MATSESNPQNFARLPLYDPSTDTIVAARAANVSTSAGGVVSGDLGVDVEVTVSPTSNQRVNAQAGDFVDGAVSTIGLKADAAVTNPASSGSVIALLKGLLTRIGTTLGFDNTNELKTSVYGKNSAAGDTALQLNSDGSLYGDIRRVAGNAIAPGSNAVPILSSAATGYVAAYGSNPAALTSSTDYSFKWGASGTTQVNHIMIQNNTSTNLNFDLDVAATAGSPLLAPGQTIFFDVQTTVVHLFQAGTPNVNGSSASNVVVRGWL